MRNLMAQVTALMLVLAKALRVMGLDAVGVVRGVALQIGCWRLMRSVIRKDASVHFALGAVIITIAVRSARWGVTQQDVMNIGDDFRWTEPGSDCPYAQFTHAADSLG